MRRQCIGLLVAMALFSLSACAPRVSVKRRRPPGEPLLTLADAFPVSGEIAGWTASELFQQLNGVQIYAHLDALADRFLSRGLTRIGIVQYAGGEKERLAVEIYEMETLAKAEEVYLLETDQSSGAPPIQIQIRRPSIGRIQFWQDRYFIRILGLTDEIWPTIGEDLIRFQQICAGRLDKWVKQPKK